MRSNTTGNNYNDDQEVNMAKPSDVLRRLEKMVKNEFVPSIGPVKGRIITEIIKKYNPKNILEVGTLYGYSAILMATTAATDILQADGKIVTIEIDRSVADIARKNVVLLCIQWIRTILININSYTHLSRYLTISKLKRLVL